MSAETSLILACCRPIRASGRVDAIRDAAVRGFDPAALLAHARHHRVEGFMHAGLKAAAVVLPATQAALLEDRVRRARLQMLRNAAEEVRVTRALRETGIDVVSLKGSSLSMIAHGTLALKSAWDVDLLVRPDTRDRADAVLATLGYRPQVFDGRRTAREIERYAATMKDMVWQHHERGTTVERHIALFDGRADLPGVGLESPRTTVDLPGVGTVETLAPAPLFAYLCVHGARHGWIRLKWLTDLAGLMHGREAMIEDWFEEATALGAGRPPGMGVLLAHRLLGTALPPRLAITIGRDRTASRLASVAQALIDGSRSDEASVLRTSLAQKLLILTLPYRLRPGLGHGWRALASGLRQPRHPLHLKLPRVMVPVAVLAWLSLRLASRPWRWLSARAGRWRAGRSDRPPRIRRPRPGRT